MVPVRYVSIALLLLLGAAGKQDATTRHLWIANKFVLAHTRYRVHRIPNVIWLSRKEMDKLAADEDAICNDGSDGTTVAMERGGAIYLIKGEFKLGRDDQTLVHETTHFQQDNSPHEPHSLGVIEKEAYDVESQYVKYTHRGELPDPEMVATISNQTCTQ